MYLATLVCPTSIPSLSSSPWIRGAPHNGFAMLMSRINWRSSSNTAGRPGRRLDFQRQYDRKPARCQRITVSGRMMASASLVFGNKLQTQTRIDLSTAENGKRPTLPRRSTMIWCRSTSTSASSAARDRIRSRTRPKINLMRPNIWPSVARFCAPRQPVLIYDIDSDEMLLVVPCIEIVLCLGRDVHRIEQQRPRSIRRRRVARRGLRALEPQQPFAHRGHALRPDRQVAVGDGCVGLATQHVDRVEIIGGH